MDNGSTSSSRRNLYIALIIALSFVILIFLVSIPVTKKRYTSSTRSSNSGSSPTTTTSRREFSEIVQENKVVRFRSIGNGQFYKTYPDSLRLLTSYPETTPEKVENYFLNNSLPYGTAASATSFAPSFAQNKITPDIGEDAYIDQFDRYILQKYRISTKPADLTQEQYQELLEFGWYIIPTVDLFYPSPSAFGALIKQFVFGDREILASLRTLYFPGGPLTSREDYEEFILNTPENIQRVFDSAFEYRNVLRFVRERENDDLFSLEPVLLPNISYQVTRHVLMRPEVALSEEGNLNLDSLFSNPDVDVSASINLQSVAMPASSTTDPVRKGFYIEE